MPFSLELPSHRPFECHTYCDSVKPEDVARIFAKKKLTAQDFLALISDAAQPFLEQMATRAQSATRTFFGNAIVLFTPLYAANICENRCLYCSFAQQNKITRKKMTQSEIAAAADRITHTGVRHVLLLTGESRTATPVSYLAMALSTLRKKCAALTIEVYPLLQEEYAECVASGADGLTIYQETYEPATYAHVHAGGPKADYAFRIDAPERGLAAGMRSVTIGPLFGLADWRGEAYATALHIDYLQKKFPEAEIGVSFPRIRPLVAEFNPTHPIDDRRLVQVMLAMRIFAPSLGMTVTTRESAPFRDGITPLCITKMSAGVSTAVGGDDEASQGQFEISDTRSLGQMCADLEKMGLQPVLHDWNNRLTRS